MAVTLSQLRACLDATVPLHSPYKSRFSFRFKTESRPFEQQERSPNGTVPILPNKPLGSGNHHYKPTAQYRYSLRCSPEAHLALPQLATHHVPSTNLWRGEKIEMSMITAGGVFKSDSLLLANEYKPHFLP